MKEAKAIEKVTMSGEALAFRIAKAIKMREAYVDTDIKNYHVVLQRGNSKTGANVWTVSLLPIIDCENCSGCSGNCYDVRNDFCFPNVMRDRAKNSAIHHLDRKRYWQEIEYQVKANYVEYLRGNVGGDYQFEDFIFINEMVERNPKLNFMFFTKNYEAINRYLDLYGDFNERVHAIWSVWPGMEGDNKHHLPEAHVVFKGQTPPDGAYACGGNCTECAFCECGCWNLKKGEKVYFNAH